MRSIKMNAIKIARFGIFALCLIMAFAIIFAGTAGTLTNEIAHADAEEEGTMRRAPGDHGELTADVIGFPGSNGGTRSWSYTETFNSIAFSADTNLCGIKNSTSGSAFFIDPGTGGFSFGMREYSSYSWQMFAVFNYDMSTFLTNLVTNHSNVTVKATLTAKITKNRGNNSGVKIIATNKMIDAGALSAEIDGKSLDKVGFAYNSSNDTTLSHSVTLTADTPNIALAFAAGGALQVGGAGTTINVSNITLKFDITMATPADSAGTKILDNEAPVITGIGAVDPLRTDNTNNGTPWNYYPSHNNITQNLEDQILSLYQGAVDYADNKMNAYHNSYVNAALDKKYIDGNGSYEYYKSLTQTFVDVYSYGSATKKQTQNSNYQWFASGIKSVQIGENTVYLYNVSNGQKSTATPIVMTEDDKQVTYGWFRVQKNHRAEIVVETYFCKNGNFNVTVTDYGDKQITRAINVNGIDLDDPTEMESFMDDAMEYVLDAKDWRGVSSWNSIKWHNLSTLAFDFNEDIAETQPGHTPYIWYYSVVKADSPTELYSENWSREQLLMKMPFAVNGLSFVYDFETGYANPTYKNGAIQYGVDNQNGGTNATGVGYYLFTFYKMDLSGRFVVEDNVRSYYVKVDYEKAVHTLEKQSNGNTLANTDWAAGAPLEIVLTQDKPNVSGNTLTFNYIDNNENELTANVFVNNGQVVGGTANTFVLNKDTGYEVVVTYELNGEGKAVWTVKLAHKPLKTEQGVDIYFNYNYVTNFELSTGIDLDAENLITYTDSAYAGGVYIRADRNLPVAPNLMNRDELEGEYIVEADDFEIPAVADRSWFTNSWTFPGQFDFSDELLGDFGNEIKVYYAMKNVVSASDLESGCIPSFLADYETGYGDLASYGFDFYTSIGGGGLDDLNPVDLVLDGSLGSGMRVFFFWTVDQAGNRSALNKYYILSDANTYYVTGHVHNGVFTTQTDVTVVSGGSKTAYKRGQSAVIEYAIDDESPYVPYKLMVNSGGLDLFPLWITDDPTSKDISYEEAPITIDGTTFTLFMDSVDGTLDKMDTQDGNAMDVYFYFREYVEIAVLNNSVYYEGAPTTVPYTISNENAIPYIEYNFEGFVTNDRPVDVGTYNFTMHIDTDDYITDAPSTMPYYINKKAVEIRINSTTGVYGDNQVFGYTVNGLVGKDLDAWDGVNYAFTPESGLYLPTPEKWIVLGGQNLTQNNFSTHAVGAYKLVFDTALSNGAISENYELPTLVEAKHVISQREIVVSVVAGEKVYGDSDKAINFSVDASTLPAGITSANITTVLKNATVVSSIGGTITLTGEGLITREAGEDVGAYGYRASTSSFDVDSNYKVVIDVEGKVFTITKRSVKVTPQSGQEFVWTEEGAYDVVYSLDDYRYADALSVTWSFAQNGDATTVLGFENYVMIVSADLASSNSNVEFTFQSGVTITVKKALPEVKSIVISRVGGALSKVYDGSATLAKVVITASDNAGFNMVVTGGDLPEGYRVEFTPTINGSNVGNYVVEVSALNVDVFAPDNTEITGYNVLVESYNFSITPATVTVRPTFTSTEKTYGDMDSAYGIGFEVSGAVAGQDLTSAIKGSFVRAIYEGSEFKAYGERYDGVSNADGTFEKGGITYRYGIAVGTTFTSSNANYVVEVADLSSYALAINPKAINFASINLTGAYAHTKSYNNSNNTIYADGEKAMMFDVTALLVRFEDDVHLDFTALFSETTGIEAGDNKVVNFSDFVIIGTDSGNYVLVGAEGFVLEVSKTKDGGTIKITEEPLVIEKRFFSIEKVYDGTSTITEANIKIDNACMLAGVEFYIVNPVSFNSANVTTNFATDLVLMFVGIDENTFDYSDEAMEMFSFELEGAKLSLSAVPGTITAKEITLDDFTSMTATDRIFNGKTAVDVEYTLNSAVFGAGDGYSDLGLTITANAEDANVGTHAVLIDAPVFSANSNYTSKITAEQITAYFGLDVDIERAQVALNVNYDPNKQYNGVNNTTLTNGSDVTKGDGYAFRLVSDIDMDADVWAGQIGSITWDFGATTFTYTVAGVPNASVAYSSGRVVDHNVLVSGLVLNTTNPDGLGNYEIVAVEWDDVAGDYVPANVALEAGTALEFECLAVAPMARKVVTANNNITVLDKIYDGTRTAHAMTNDMTGLGVLPEDADYVNLKFDATFETKNVGEQNVSLRIIGFEDKPEDDRDLAANYAINSTTTWVTRQSILPAPMVVEANVGTKVYDGTGSIDLGRIQYTLTGKYPAETDSYSVNVLAGHFVDANVFDEMGNVPEFKTAKLYGIELKNLSTSKVNYYPVISSATPIAGKTPIATDALGALPATDGEGNPIYYYAILTEEVYILTATDYNKLAVKPASEHLIGTYTRAGKTYYLISGEATIDGHDKTAIAVDNSAKGSITPKAVSIAVEVVEGHEAVFNKEYDGTNVFNGILGTDYQVSTAGGFVGTDNEHVTLDTTKYTVQYMSSKAGATDVKFVFGEGALTALGSDNTYLNYTATGATFVIKGIIKQVEMTVTLGDITATYGDDPSTYAFDLTYMANGAEVVVEGGKGYVLYDGTNHPLGYDDYWMALSDDQKNALRYNLVDGVFVQANDGAYIVLADVFTTPSIVTNANKQTIVGEYSATLKGGSATNYFLTPVYTSASGSKVTIAKKALTVSAVKSGDYTADYLGALPAITLSYAGFVNGDGANKITVADGATKFVFFNGTDYVDMPANAIPSDKLEEGQYYAVAIDVTKLSAQNYDIVLGTAEAKLVISIPALTGITMKDTTVTYDGTVQNGKVSASGALEGVTAEYKFYLGSVVADEFLVSEVKNAGTYTVVATFTKAIGEYTQSTSITRTFTVNKTTIKVNPSIGGYDYHDYNFAKDIEKAILNSLTGPASADLNTVKDALEITFYRDGKKVTKIEDAGNYVVEVVFTSPTTTDTAKKATLANYSNYRYTYNFKVNAAPITVTINLEATNIVAEFDYDGNFVLPASIPVVFTYDFGEAYKAKYGVDASDIDASKFQVQFVSNGTAVKASKVLTGSGVFEFVIAYLNAGKSSVTDSSVSGYKVITVGADDAPSKDVDGNYTLTGNFGSLNISLVTIGNDDFSVEFLDGVGVVASGLKLTVTEIYEDAPDDNDYFYWEAINTYTPYISTESHTATLEAVMRLRMVMGNTNVQPASRVRVGVQLYLNEEVDEYVFYTVGQDGALHLLTDYEIDDDGYITYETDVIDSLIAFHLEKNEPVVVEQGLPEWIWYAVGGGGGALVLASVITGVVVGKKKKDKKKGDDTPDGDKPEDDKPEDKTEEPKTEEKPEVKEEVKPEPKVEEKPAEAPKAEEPKAEPTPEPTPEPVKPRPSKPSVVGKKKPPVIGQKVTADGAPAPTTATPVTPPTPAPKAEPTKPAEAPKTPEVKPEPKAVEKPAEAPKAEPAKAETPAEKKPPVVGDKKPPVVGEKKPPVVGEKKPPVVGEKKPPVIGNKQ